MFLFTSISNFFEQGGSKGESDEDAALPREGHTKLPKFLKLIKQHCNDDNLLKIYETQNKVEF